MMHGRKNIKLDNLESEIAEGARGAADRGDLSKNGWNIYFI